MCIFLLPLSSRASKVFTNHHMVQQNGCQECFAEVYMYTNTCISKFGGCWSLYAVYIRCPPSSAAQPLPVFLQALEGDIQCSVLQAGVRQYLHRMIICLGDELLKYVPMAVSLLLKDCKASKICCTL